MGEAAVILQGIKKCYKLYRSPLERIKEAMHPFRKHYAETFTALKKVDLEIPFGETWGIIGLNGSGKSTLLKIICGVIQPSAGSVKVNGRISALLELGSGFNPEYTGRENLFFAGITAGFSRSEMENRYAEIAAFAEIGEFMDQPVKNYSSGMLMRLAFAVSVHVEPDILVIDEALAVGDARFQHKCMKKIKSFQGRSTIILVTHDMNAVLTLCDRVAWLHKGSLLEVGEPKVVVDKYTRLFYENRLSKKEERMFQVSETEKIAESTDNILVKKDEDRAVENRGAIGKNCSQIFNGFGCKKILDVEGSKASSFGFGGVKITRMIFVSRQRGLVETVYGGEPVSVSIWLKTYMNIDEPVVGFLVKNKLGIEIFGFNTITMQAPFPPLIASNDYRVDFTFVWPEIAADNYAITIAVADGSMEECTMHHMVQDVMIVEVLKTRQYQVGLLSLNDVKSSITLTNKENKENNIQGGLGICNPAPRKN